MIAEGRVGQKSNKAPKSVDFHNNLFTVFIWAPNQTQAQDRPPFLFRLSRRWVRGRGSDLLPRLHQHSRILLLRLSARWRTFIGRLWRGRFSTWQMKTGSWRFSCVKQSKQDVILPHLRFMYTAEKTVLVFLNNLWGLGIGLSYRPARLQRLAQLVPWNRLLGSIKVKKFGLW